MIRILNVCSWLGPPFDGGNINRLEILKRISSDYDSRFLILKNSHDSRIFDQKDLLDLGVQNSGMRFVKLPKLTKFDYLQGLLFSKYPAGIFARDKAYRKTLEGEIKAICKEWDPDVLFLWNPALAYSFSSMKLTIQSRILYACDSMSFIFRSMAQNHCNYFNRKYFSLSLKGAEYVEKKVFPKFNKVIFISRRDGEFSKFDGEYEVVCNGVDIDKFQVKNELKLSNPTIGFHGNLSYEANRNAVRFIYKHVLPSLKSKIPNLSVKIIGGPEDAVKKLSDECSGSSMHFTGYVEDLTAELNSLWAYVSPITIGAGVKNKILEAMACGLPVFGTRESFNGIDVGTNEVVFCDNTGDSFCENISNKLENSNCMLTLGNNARRWISSNADWSAVSNKISTLIDECVN